MALVDEIELDLRRHYNMNPRDLLNPRFMRSDNIVSWQQRQPREPFDSYLEYYDWAIRKRQYSFQLEDGSCLQLFYEVNGQDLAKASLAYLPSVLAVQSGLTYLRFDCDHEAHLDDAHAAYHIHFGFETNIRVSLYRFPLPSLFIKFIQLVAYGKTYSIPSAFSHRIGTLDIIGDNTAYFLKLL